MSKNDKWSALSMRDKASLIKLFTDNGITSLSEMKLYYNGGNKSWTKEQLKYFNNINSYAIRHPEWFWGDSKEAANARQYLYLNNAEDLISDIYNNTPEEIRSSIDRKKLPNEIKGQQFNTGIQEAINKGGRVMTGVLAGSAAIPLAAELSASPAIASGISNTLKVMGNPALAKTTTGAMAATGLDAYGLVSGAQGMANAFDKATHGNFTYKDTLPTLLDATTLIPGSSALTNINNLRTAQETIAPIRTAVSTLRNDFPGVKKRAAEAILRLGDRAQSREVFDLFKNKNVRRFVFNPTEYPGIEYKLGDYYDYSGEGSESWPHVGDVVDQYLGKAEVPNATFDTSILPKRLQDYIEKNYKGVKIPIRNLGEVETPGYYTLYGERMEEYVKKLMELEEGEGPIRVSAEYAGIKKDGKHMLDPGGFNSYVTKKGDDYTFDSWDIWKFNPKDYSRRYDASSLLQRAGLHFLNKQGTPIIHRWTNTSKIPDTLSNSYGEGGPVDKRQKMYDSVKDRIIQQAQAKQMATQPKMGEQPLTPLEYDIASLFTGVGDIEFGKDMVESIGEGNLKDAAISAGLLLLPGIMAKPMKKAIGRDANRVINEARAYKTSEEYKKLVERARKESVDMGIGDFPEEVFVGAERPTNAIVTNSERRQGSIGGYSQDTHSIDLDRNQIGDNYEDVLYHEALHSVNVGIPSLDADKNYRLWLDAKRDGNEEAAQKAFHNFIQDSGQTKRHKRDIADKYIERKTSEVLYDDADEYLRRLGELQANGLEAGRHLGLKPFAEYPGKKEAKKVIRKAREYNPWFWDIKAGTENEIKDFWKILTGQYTPAIVGAGVLGAGVVASENNN